MYNSIRFSNNHNNKLFCRSFSTVRLYSEKYRLQENYTILFGADDNNVIELGSANLVYIHALKTIEEINNAMSFIDIGYNRETLISMLKKMYSQRNINWHNQGLLFMIFQRDKKPKLTNELKPAIFE